MSKIIHKNGDALNGSELFFAHGCNNQGVMGAGIAKQVKQQFPLVYKKYVEFYNNYGLTLGDVVLVEENNKVFFNIITQTLSDSKRRLSYDAIYDGFVWIDNYMKKLDIPEKDKQVAMPQIGAGLGGGNWNIISQIIDETSINYIPVVYFYKL